MSAFWLALASGAAHAGWNALAKSAGSERAVPVAALSVAWVASLMVAAVMPGAHLELGSWPWLVLAGGGEAAYVVCLGLAYRHGDLALTYSLTRASALVFIWPLSWLAFSVAPTGLALVATALVALGIALVRKPASGTSRWHPGWTLATGASVALYHTGYKGSLEGGTSELIAFICAIALALPLIAVFIGREARRQVPAVLRQPRVLAAGLLCGTSFVLMLFALANAESGRILGVRNASVGIAVVLALLLGERLSARQWLGLAVMSAGVVLFAFAG
ncbi:MAG: hypothetical protein JNG84_11535 [Archangium sp.]|nr:hypothetical protein [Archangium sp.]